MGRYYSGDIEGKFWFAVQPSNSCERFGGESFEPQYISFYFNKNNFNLEELQTLIKEVNKKLDLNIHLRSNPNDMYNNINMESIDRTLLTKMADVAIGLKIYQCIEDTGECSFDAEL